MPILPVELLDNILDFLDPDDYDFSPTLRACALVDRNFLSICRPRLFSTISLNEPNCLWHCYEEMHGYRKISTSSMLHQLLTEWPELADHIRVLGYHYFMDDEIEHPAHLAETFKMITRLTSLSIVIPLEKNSSSISWMVNPLRPALLNLLHLPTLVSCRIIGPGVKDFVPNDLSPCIGLKELYVAGITVSTLPSDALNSPIRLRELEIGVQSPSVMNWIRGADGRSDSPFDFASLTKLSFHSLDETDFEAALRLLSQCKSLIALCIFNEGRRTELDGLSNALVIPNSQAHPLKYLQIHTRHHKMTDEDDDLSGISQELQNLSGNNTIESLTIHIRVLSYCDPEGEWQRINQALAFGWPDLRKFTLTVEIEASLRHIPGGSELDLRIHSSMITEFNNLWSNRSLEFEVGCEFEY